MPEFFLGVDPGENGGMAMLKRDGSVAELAALSSMTDKDVVEWLGLSACLRDTFAVIEEQRPRPTNFFDREAGRWRASILKSTCQLYGHYRALRALLTATGVPFVTVEPKKWQQVLCVPPKERGEADRKWKGKLKALAQQLFPGEKVTLAVADALLLAAYARTKHD